MTRSSRRTALFAERFDEQGCPWYEYFQLSLYGLARVYRHENQARSRRFSGVKKRSSVDYERYFQKSFHERIVRPAS